MTFGVNLFVGQQTNGGQYSTSGGGDDSIDNCRLISNSNSTAAIVVRLLQLVRWRIL